MGELALDWLNLDAFPHLIMTEQLVVTWMNLRAREELARNDFLVLREGVLSTIIDSDGVRLAKLLTSCRQGAASLSLSRGDRHMVLRARGITDAQGNHIGLKFYRTDQNLVCRYADLDSAFGLTRSETLVVQHMSDGMSADQVGEKMGSTVETIRSHIRSIYKKTGANCREALLHRVRPFQL